VYVKRHRANHKRRLTQTPYNLLGTTATKSRTGFCSGIENALPFSRANQNALEEPPSRFIARSIFKSEAIGTVARAVANSASETSEQKPSNPRSFRAVAAKVRRATADSFSARTR